MPLLDPPDYRRVADDGVSAAGTASDTDTTKGEASDRAVLDRQPLSGKEIDAPQPRAEPLDIQVFKNHDIIRTRIDRNAVSPGN